MPTQVVKMSASGRRQTIRFTGDDAHELALARTRDYCGERLWGEVLRFIASSPPPRSLHFQLMFAGVEGYPVRALLKEYHPRYVRRFGPYSARNAKGQ